MTATGHSTGAKFKDLMDLEDSVGIYEFATRLGYTYTYIYQQVRLGALPARKVKGIWLIPRAVLDRAIKGLGQGDDVIKEESCQ